MHATPTYQKVASDEDPVRLRLSADRYSSIHSRTLADVSYSYTSDLVELAVNFHPFSACAFTTNERPIFVSGYPAR